MHDDDPGDAPSHAPSDAAVAQAPRRARRLLWLLGVPLVLLLLILALGAGVGTWVWRSEGGARWALGHVPGLQVQGWRGAPGQGALAAERLVLTTDAGVLDMSDVQLHGLRWVWNPAPRLWLRVELDRASANTLTWRARASAKAPSSAAPTSLRSPVALRLPQLRIERLVVGTAEPLRRVRADLDLGADGGRVHRVNRISLHTSRFALGAQAVAQADGALPLAAAVRLIGLPQPGAPAWQAGATASGPLAALAVQGALQGQPAGAQAPARVQVRGEVRPFAAWPLGDLTLRTQALDLSQLLAGAPRTRLDVQADVASAGLTQPARVSVQAANAQAGRWSDGALPVRALTLRASGTPQPLRQLALTELDLDLGSASARAGHLRGSGELRFAAATAALQEAHLKLNADALEPAALDVRAPVMRLSGPITVHATQLDQPGAWQGVLETALRGAQSSAAGASTPLTLALKAQAAPQGITIREALASAGAAQAKANGRITGPLLSGNPATPWGWEVKADVHDFNPALWWPGQPGSAWRSGSHRLTFAATSSGSASAAVLADPAAAWRQVRASASADIAPSQLAGVALQGNLRLQLAGDASSASGQLRAGRNTLTLPSDAGNAQRFTLNWDAPHLEDLAPLVALANGAAPWAPQTGRSQGQLTLGNLVGRQPLSVAIKADAHDVQTPRLSVAELALEGSSALAPDAALKLSARATGLVQGLATQAGSSSAPRADRVTLDLGGTWRDHRLAIEADTPLRPPKIVEQLFLTPSGNGSRLRATLSGKWTLQTARDQPWWRAGRWSGVLAEVSGSAREGGAPWLEGRNLALSARWTAAGLQEARAEPGRLTLPGTALRWQQAYWDGSGRTPQLALDADLDAIAVAPLLARAQPEQGWRGDLTLGGSVRIRRGSQLDADIVFERVSGDLAVASDVRSARSAGQPLGLSALRLALSAHGGHWQFVPAFAGTRVGELAGVLSVQASPQAVWPAPAAPITGALQFRAADLASWALWLPPGWRAGGELASSVSFSGTFGAPLVTGELRGSQLVVRNVLEGVEAKNGTVAITLQGSSARIDRFEFQGGEGWLRAQGQATLGATPSADLRVQLDRFQALGRIDRRVVVSGDVSARLGAERYDVSGELRADEGLIDISRGSGPTLSADVSVVHRAASAASAGATAPAAPATRTARSEADASTSPSAAARQMQLNLRIDLGEKLHLRGRGIDTGLRGKLALTSPNGRPQLRGQVRTDEGHYTAYGQNLAITRGQLTFTGPVEEPRLDILAERPNLDVRVGVAVTGLASNPQVRLFSEPEMSDMDKLSWLMLGRAPTGLGEADTALLQRAAMALLAGEDESDTTAALRQLGLTDFGVRQTDDGSTRDTIVTLGKQISKRWYVGYERSINSATGTWQLIYRVAQRLTLRATAGNEDSSIDGTWMWRWD